MPSATFTALPPGDMLTVQVGAPPPGSTALAISFQLIPPPSPGPETVRLLHLRRSGKNLKVAASEVLEIKYDGLTGEYTAGFSGFGVKHAKALPVHMGKVTGAPVDVLITVPIGPGEASVAVGPLFAHASPDLAAVGNLELLMGFSGPGDLKPPAGWTVLWDESVLRWLTGSSPSLPPPAPQAQPPALPLVIAPPTPPPSLTPPPGADPRAAAIALTLQLLLPQLPPQEAAILQPIIQAGLAGGQLNTRTILLALLPLLLGGA